MRTEVAWAKPKHARREENSKSTLDNDITDRFYTKLETQIYKDPSQYLWSHRRFKHEGREPK